MHLYFFFLVIALSLQETRCLLSDSSTALDYVNETSCTPTLELWRTYLPCGLCMSISGTAYAPATAFSLNCNTKQYDLFQGVCTEQFYERSVNVPGSTCEEDAGAAFAYIDRTEVGATAPECIHVRYSHPGLNCANNPARVQALQSAYFGRRYDAFQAQAFYYNTGECRAVFSIPRGSLVYERTESDCTVSVYDGFDCTGNLLDTRGEVACSNGDGTLILDTRSGFMDGNCSAGFEQFEQSPFSSSTGTTGGVTTGSDGTTSGSTSGDSTSSPSTTDAGRQSSAASKLQWML